MLLKYYIYLSQSLKPARCYQQFDKKNSWRCVCQTLWQCYSGVQTLFKHDFSQRIDQLIHKADGVYQTSCLAATTNFVVILYSEFPVWTSCSWILHFKHFELERFIISEMSYSVKFVDSNVILKESFWMSLPKFYQRAPWVTICPFDGPRICTVRTSNSILF